MQILWQLENKKKTNTNKYLSYFRYIFNILLICLSNIKNRLNISVLVSDKLIKLKVDTMITNFLQININKAFERFTL